MTPEQLAAMRDRATRPRRTVPIVLDGNVAEQLEQLHSELETLQKPPPEAKDRRLSTKAPRAADAAAVADLEARIDAAYQQAESVTLNVVIEGLAGTPWQTFRSTHPMRPDVQADQVWRFNIEAGREPLIRVTAIGHKDVAGQIHPFRPADPDADDEAARAGDLEWLLGFATDFQLDKLFLAALECCRGDDAVPLPRPRSATPSSGDG